MNASRWSVPVALTLASWACSKTPTSPTGPPRGATSFARLEPAGSAGVANDPPDVVFRTTPRADATGRIVGRAPLTVTFNMCPTTDPDEGDELKFKYDFDGTGVFERGRCRGTHVYRKAGCKMATVCASDRQPTNGDICRTYQVCAEADEGNGGGGGGGPAGLQLYLWNGASSGNGTDFFRVQVDGTTVFNVVTGAPAYAGGFALVNVDLTPFADGGTHVLTLQATTNGATPTNFSVDDVFVGCLGGANSVTDAGFEAGSPNPFWMESSTNFGSPLCTAQMCGDGGGTAGPRSGSWWGWFGGFSGGTESASLVQAAVVVPSCQ
jgi:hypothetical protein